MEPNWAACKRVLHSTMCRCVPGLPLLCVQLGDKANRTELQLDEYTINFLLLLPQSIYEIGSDPPLVAEGTLRIIS